MRSRLRRISSVPDRLRGRFEMRSSWVVGGSPTGENVVVGGSGGCGGGTQEEVFLTHSQSQHERQDQHNIFSSTSSSSSRRRLRASRSYRDIPFLSKFRAMSGSSSGASAGSGDEAGVVDQTVVDHHHHHAHNNNNNINSTSRRNNNNYATLVNAPAGMHGEEEEDEDGGHLPSSSTSSLPNNNNETTTSSSEEVVSSGDPEHPYSIRLTPFVDHSSTMPALYIGAVERKAKDGTVIKIGRYTDKKDESQLSEQVTPIVFKSKVVSRSHAEFFVSEGKWYIRDVKSSSGTFLNSTRLAPACHESEPFPIHDGDVLQLGMDFRGGSEEIYKCIKVRLEINKSWQKKANNFNVNALSNLRNLFAAKENKTHQDNQECAICLLPVSPLQALFIAPCSHAWHYKCIRPLIIKPYPHFLCPNCRAICDLEADIEVPDLSHLQVDSNGLPPANPDA
ncbi:hypothetical protein TRICI_000750 [Trichomonascus ciferrii]|uniref:RING-type E3 ubiquitin transferase n=1 Tax=Trichomonascus ciferrii TaxID=44093 RepID=A0A642VB48_9ASCO|nr:hypothetical protein TRICI_000750 [Trichomonascus ciferrii]